jgi:hypothetical protein
MEEILKKYEEKILKNPLVFKVAMVKNELTFWTYNRKRCVFTIERKSEECYVSQNTVLTPKEIRKEAILLIQKWMDENKINSLVYFSPRNESKVCEYLGLKLLEKEDKNELLLTVKKASAEAVYIFEKEKGTIMRKIKELREYKAAFGQYFKKREDALERLKLAAAFSHREKLDGLRKKINVYFQGEDLEFHLFEEEKVWKILIPKSNETIEVESIEDMNSKLDEWFEKKQLSNRMEHLYNPPKEGFEKFLSRTILNKLGNQEYERVKKRIWKYFEKKGNLVEIDTYLLKNTNYFCREETFQYDFVFLLHVPVYDEFLLIDHENSDLIIAMSDFNKAKKLFIEKKLKIMEKTLNKTIVFRQK